MKPVKQQAEIILQVVSIISERTIDNPITGSAIGGIVGISWRAVADCVEQARQMNYKIGASKGDPPGYFLARTPEELYSTIGRLTETSKKMLSQARSLARWNHREPTLLEGEELHRIETGLKEINSMEKMYGTV